MKFDGIRHLNKLLVVSSVCPGIMFEQNRDNWLFVSENLFRLDVYADGVG